MKNKQLLSIVFSLIMITGVSAGSAYAQTDDLEEAEEILEDFCELDFDQKRQFFSDYPQFAQYDQRIAAICEIEDEDERDDALEAFIEEVIDETRDTDNDEIDDNSEIESETDEKSDDKDKMHDDAENRLEKFCLMSEDEQASFFADHERIAQFKERLLNLCEIENEDEREDAIEDFVEEILPEARSNINMYLDKYFNKGKGNLGDRFAMMCEMDEDAKSEFLEMISDLPEDIREKLSMFCDMTEEEQRAFIDSMHDRMDDFKEEHKMMVREMQERHKEISEDKAKYEKFCQMSEGQRILEIEDPERLAEISEWCNMTPEERMEFAKQHRKAAMDFKEEHMNALDRMKANKDLSPRLRAMILNENDDDDASELRKELREKAKELDEKRDELKAKFREAKSEMMFRFSEISDDRKSEIKERHKEMMEFKEELRLKSDSLTDEEKQELRAQFIEKAKNMQLAWITPRDQVSAGIEPDQIECREGYSLVIKNSNGLPMCVTTKTAIKMIEKGYAVPINPAN